MDIVINTKNKLKEEDLKNYVLQFYNLPIKIAIPYSSISAFSKYNVISQNYIDKKVLTSNKVKGVLLGHSDYKENLVITSKKVQDLINSNFKIYLFVGENTKEEKSISRLKKDLDKLLTNVTNFEELVIIYEPVWAIENKEELDFLYIKNIASKLKYYINTKYSNIIKLYYGGSVNDKNIESLNKLSLFDGYVISSFALKNKKFKSFYLDKL